MPVTHSTMCLTCQGPVKRYRVPARELMKAETPYTSLSAFKSVNENRVECMHLHSLMHFAHVEGFRYNLMCAQHMLISLGHEIRFENKSQKRTALFSSQHVSSILIKRFPRRIVEALPPISLIEYPLRVCILIKLLYDTSS